MRSRVIAHLLDRFAEDLDPAQPEASLRALVDAVLSAIRAPALALYVPDEAGALRRETYGLRAGSDPSRPGEETHLAQAHTEAEEDLERLARLGLHATLGGRQRLDAPETTHLVTGTQDAFGVRVPLRGRGRLAAVIACGPYDARRHARRDARDLAAAGPLLALSLLPMLHAARLEREATRARRRSLAEREALSVTVDGSRMTEALLGLAAQAAGFSGAFYATLDQDQARLSHRVDVPQAFPAAGSDLAGSLLSLHRIGDQVLITAGEEPALKAAGVARILALPISAGGEVVGVAGLVSPRADATPDEQGLEVLRLYASQLEVVTAQQRDRARLGNSYLQSLETLAAGLDMISPATRGHTHRVIGLADAIAKALPSLDAEDRQALEQAARVHDVGLYGGRQGALAVSSEFRHPLLGAELAALGPGGEAAARAVAEHHETWDGVGFPEAKAGDAISLPGQILAAAEYLVERTTRSAVGPAWSLQAAAEAAEAEAGQRFSPEVARAAATACRGLAAERLPCHALKSCPPSIRAACAAAAASGPCYHVPATECARHGDPDCAGCVVYRTWGGEAPAEGGPS